MENYIELAQWVAGISIPAAIAVWAIKVNLLQKSNQNYRARAIRTASRALRILVVLSIVSCGFLAYVYLGGKLIPGDDPDDRDPSSIVGQQTVNLVELDPLENRPSADLKFNETLEVDNEHHPNSIRYFCSIWCGSGSYEGHITYNLSQDWNRLDMHVGIANETVSYDQVATFTFKVNNVEVLKETVKKGEPMAPVSLDVSNANDIELIVSTNKTGDEAVLAWVSPTLTK